MMTFNYFLGAITLFLAFGVLSTSVNSFKAECPIIFPEGFFCDVICEHWGILPGNTIMCFISHQGQYERFVARNPAYGVWRFYQIDTTSPEDQVCHYSRYGDEYFLNNTDLACAPPAPRVSNYYMSQVKTQFQTGEYDINNLTPASRNGVDSRVPMDAICELATTQFCRRGKIITCLSDNKCCYTKVTPDSCDEENMSKFSECYQALYNVMQNTTYY